MKMTAHQSVGNGMAGPSIPVETMDFVRYVAELASGITSGEAHPDDVNWRYLRERASAAIRAAEGRH